MPRRPATPPCSPIRCAGAMHRDATGPLRSSRRQRPARAGSPPTSSRCRGTQRHPAAADAVQHSNPTGSTHQREMNVNYDGYFEKLRGQMAERYQQPIEAMLMVHQAPDGAIGAVGRLHTNNVLVLTPTHLRVVALGGRSGVKPRDEVAAWERSQVLVEGYDTEKGSWMRTTMSWYSY